MKPFTRKVTASLRAISLTLAATTLLAMPSGDVDQQQPAIDPGGTWAIGGPSGQILAQVFTAGINGALTELQLPIVCAQDGGNLIVEIQGVTSDGLPNGVVMTSETIPSASFPAFFPAPPSFRNLVFHVPVAPLRVGDRFAVVLRASSVCGIFRGPSGDTYGGGRAYYISQPNSSSAWLPLGFPNGDSDDLPFLTLGHGGGR